MKTLSTLIMIITALTFSNAQPTIFLTDTSALMVKPYFKSGEYLYFRLDSVTYKMKQSDAKRINFDPNVFANRTYHEDMLVFSKTAKAGTGLMIASGVVAFTPLLYNEFVGSSVPVTVALSAAAFILVWSGLITLHTSFGISKKAQIKQMAKEYK